MGLRRLPAHGERGVDQSPAGDEDPLDEQRRDDRGDDQRNELQEDEGPGSAPEVEPSERLQSFVKEPNTPDRTPWHNDLPFWPIRGRQVITTWVAPDAVTGTSGAVEFVAGSHLWDRWFQPRSFSGKNEHGNNPEFEPVPDIEADRGMYDILSWDLEPGDIVAFNAMTLHGSPGNTTSDRRRRGYSVRYTGDDVVYAPWPGMTTPLVKDDLVPGEPIDSVHYPVVRQPA